MKKFCKCGCGQLIVLKPYHKYYGIPDYIKGHYFKGKKKNPLTDKTKKKISETKKGSHHSEETKKKISKASKGRIFSKETRKKLSESNRGKNSYMFGKKHSLETRKRMCDNHANFKGKNHPMFGKHHTEEAKKKISEGHKGKKLSDKTKKKISEFRKGIKFSEETKKRMSKVHKGIPLSEETKRKMVEAKKGKHPTKETKQKIRESNKGKKRSKETREKMSISALKYIEENGYLYPRIGKIEPIFEETVLKKILNLKYETQKRINKIGIVDFFLTDYGIIIECDEKHHKETKQKSKDVGRDFAAMFIFKYKYDTIRFTDTEIVEQPKECIREIKKCIRMGS